MFITNDLATQPSGDMNAILGSMAPSFHVGRFAGVLLDGSGFVRPPTLRDAREGGEIRTGHGQTFRADRCLGGEHTVYNQHALRGLIGH